MPRRLIWSRAAEADLEGAYLAYWLESTSLAERFADSVGDSVELLLETPEAGRVRFEPVSMLGELRSWAVTGFPAHLIFYRFGTDHLFVVRLLHGARDLPRLLE